MKGTYADIPPSRIAFEGGLRIYGVNSQRDQNKTFLEYSTVRKGDGLLFQELQEDVPPEELQNQFKNNRVAQEAMGQDSDKQLAGEIEKQFGQKKSPFCS